MRNASRPCKTYRVRNFQSSMRARSRSTNQQKRPIFEIIDGSNERLGDWLAGFLCASAFALSRVSVGLKMRELRQIGRRLEILSRRAQPLARIVDSSPRDSLLWRQAAEKLSELTGECYRLAIRTGSEELIREAKASVAVVKGLSLELGEAH
jgi:hypothetical protein